MSKFRAPWTAAEDAFLIAAWATVETIREIAVRMDRSRSSLCERANTLRLPRKTYLHIHDTNRGMAMTGRDSEYVALCRAQGGFWAYSERRGPRGHAAVCAPLLPPVWS